MTRVLYVGALFATRNGVNESCLQLSENNLGANHNAGFVTGSMITQTADNSWRYQHCPHRMHHISPWCSATELGMPFLHTKALDQNLDSNNGVYQSRNYIPSAHQKQQHDSNCIPGTGLFLVTYPDSMLAVSRPGEGDHVIYKASQHTH